MKAKVLFIVKKALKNNIVIVLENEEVTVYRNIYFDFLNNLGSW